MLSIATLTQNFAKLVQNPQNQLYNKLELGVQVTDKLQVVHRAIPPSGMRCYATVAVPVPVAVWPVPLSFTLIVMG